ncbi:MAG: hypothetical protein MZV70_44605 [Desulfobacterales bacterium]|nr:hypothetical protein [Desulfobacterales bacterium]
MELRGRQGARACARLPLRDRRFRGHPRYITPKQGRNIFRLRDHMVRFLNSAKVLQMKVPYSSGRAVRGLPRGRQGSRPEGRLPQAASLLRRSPRGQDRAEPQQAGHQRQHHVHLHGRVHGQGPGGAGART